MPTTDPARPAEFSYTKGPAAFGIIVGAAMIVIWAYFILSGSLPELEASPLATGLHIVAEIATGIVLIVAGYGVAARRSWSRKMYLLAVGMLLFAVIHGIGFYGERNQIGFVVLFVLLGVLGIFFAMRAEE